MGLVGSAALVWAGPITGGSGNPPYTKLGVYQGVIAVIPGGSGDSVMEIGNAGRDIASTGSIYFRPNSTGAGSYFSGSGNTQNLFLNGNLGVGVAGSSYPFVVGRDVDGQVYGARFQNMSTGAAAYLRPLSFLRRNAANTTTMEWYWELPVGDVPELQLWRANRPDGQPVGWSNPVSFKYDGTTYFNGGNVGIGNITPAGKFVVNNNLAGDGSSGDAIAAYANTTGSALYAQQNNAGGWAGYFSGNVNITGTLTLGGVLKPTPGIQVCQVGSSACLGQYLYTTGSTHADLNYWYVNSANTPTAALVYSNATTCPGGFTGPLDRSTSSGLSYYEGAACSGPEYVLTAGAIAYGTGQFCYSTSPDTFTAQRSRGSGGCSTISLNRTTFRLVVDTLPGYELR